MTSSSSVISGRLTARDYAPWADWQDIPPIADWLSEVYRGIEAADFFVFIIKSTSVASEICRLEIEHAVKHNKRPVPVMRKDVHESRLTKLSFCVRKTTLKPTLSY